MDLGVLPPPPRGKTKTQRIEFIDALRGFTIFIVVFDHISLFCFHQQSFGLLSEYSNQVMNQLFFLLSGFVIFRDGGRWNAKFLFDFLRKKVPALLLGPLLFFLVYMHVNELNILDGFFHEPKYGYWYTYTLFIFLVIYAFCRFCSRGKLLDIVLLVIGVCFLPAGWPVFIAHLPVNENVLWFLCFPHWQHFIFFAMGLLIRKHYDVFQSWLDGQWLLPICITVYFLGNAFFDVFPVPSAMKNLPISFAAIICLFAFFKKNKEFFRCHRLGRFMQLVGQRTLDVYLIHYFLLPINLGVITTVFIDYSIPFIEFITSTIIALTIILFCLLIGSIIRLSPILAFWIFGAKRN